MLSVLPLASAEAATACDQSLRAKHVRTSKLLPGMPNASRARSLRRIETGEVLYSCLSLPCLSQPLVAEQRMDMA